MLCKGAHPPSPMKSQNFFIPLPPILSTVTGPITCTQQETNYHISELKHFNCHNLECKFVSVVSHCKIIQPQVQVYHVAVNHVPQGPFVFAVDATVYAVSVDCLIS